MIDEAPPLVTTSPAVLSPDVLGPVHLAYLAAALLLPVRLVVILIARAEVPRLAASVLDALQGGSQEPAFFVRKSTNPYADLARGLTILSEGGAAAAEIDAARKRSLDKARRRTLRSQALDAASLLLLLWLVAGRGWSLGPLTNYGVGFVALMLLCTILARASLQNRLETATVELASELARSAQRRAPSAACVFCGADVDPADVRLERSAGAVTVPGVACSTCGKVVATLPAAEGKAGTGHP